MKEGEGIYRYREKRKAQRGERRERREKERENEREECKERHLQRTPEKIIHPSFCKRRVV